MLNWSPRARWRPSLASLAFSFFAGHREFNPVAIVFRPFHRTRTFGSFKPYHQRKRGDARPLEALTQELCALCGTGSPHPTSRDGDAI